MSTLYLAAAFVAGWIVCWKTTGFITRKVFRQQPGEVLRGVIATMTQDALLEWDAQIRGEIEKRRAA